MHTYYIDLQFNGMRARHTPRLLHRMPLHWTLCMRACALVRSHFAHADLRAHPTPLGPPFCAAGPLHKLVATTPQAEVQLSSLAVQHTFSVGLCGEDRWGNRVPLDPALLVVVASAAVKAGDAHLEAKVRGKKWGIESGTDGPPRW